MPERLHKAFLIGILTISMSGIAGDCDGAFDSPAGPVYIGGAENRASNVAHEQCHDRLRRQIGNVEFYKRYAEDPCREEMRCRQPGEPIHPVCRGRRR